MRRYGLCILLSILCCTSVTAQSELHGKVISSDTHKPIALANVFLSNTSIGTVTNENGEFTILRFPAGRYELIISFIGYETKTMVVQSDQLSAPLQVVLTPRVNELQEVIVEPYDKDGWDKWGKIFTDNFIGTSRFAEDCKILNQDALQFRFSKKQNAIRVSSDEPILIENKALGYLLKYDLTRFEFSFSDRTFFYQGHPFFSEMSTEKESLKKRWAANREEAYYGSIMHFMRSVYTNRLQEEKFEVRKILLVSADEKKRVTGLYDSLMQKKSKVDRLLLVDGSKQTYLAVSEAPNPDSLNYFKQVKEKPVFSQVVYNQLLPADSIAFSIDKNTVGLEREHLQVIYLPKKNLSEYQKFLPRFTQSFVSSEIIPASDKIVSVLGNGSYFEGKDITFSGYWAWWGKMCNKLPYDYRPVVK